MARRRCTSPGADGACDYLLDRGTGAVSDTDEIPFVETSRYQTLTDTLDNLFDGQAHSYTYDEDARAMTAYVVIAEGMRDTLEASSLAVSAIYENWEELMDMSITITENVAEALTLAAPRWNSGRGRGHLLHRLCG